MNLPYTVPCKKALKDCADSGVMNNKAAQIGDRVEAYWNTRELCLSYRLPRGTVQHVEGLWLESVSFVIQPQGRQRFLNTGVMNTHAYMRGTLRQASNDLIAPLGDVFERITYEPARFGFFYRVGTLEAVYSARELIAIGNAYYIAP